MIGRRRSYQQNSLYSALKWLFRDTLPMTRITKLKIKRLYSSENGAATAEYAIATMAAVGFAGLLVVILRSDDVKGILFDLIRSALSLGGG